MSGLAPLVFQSAFVDGDKLALAVLGEAALAVAKLISLNCSLPSTPMQNGDARGRFGLDGEDEVVVHVSEPTSTSAPIYAKSSVLCLGGSLVGVPEYRNLILAHLAKMGHVFPHVEYVGDAAEAGVLRLVGMAKAERAL